MDELIQQLLQVSAKLFQHLTKTPKSEERDAFIDMIHTLLDERGVIVDKLRALGFDFDPNNSSHATLAELDKGINERLAKSLNVIKADMKDLNNQKKNETQYMNPYSHVQVMDGMYYDKKK